MKFQNPCFKIFLNGRTEALTDKPKAICSPLFQSWGHNYSSELGQLLWPAFTQITVLSLHSSFGQHLHGLQF